MNSFVLDVKLVLAVMSGKVYRHYPRTVVCIKVIEGLIVLLSKMESDVDALIEAGLATKDSPEIAFRNLFIALEY